MNEIRPTEPSDYQIEMIYFSIAAELQENGWTTAGKELIIDDLKGIDLNLQFSREDQEKIQLDIAKYFDSLGRYHVYTDFIGWCGHFLYRFFEKRDKAMNQRLSSWIDLNDIKPIYSKGDCLRFTSDLHRYFKKGVVAYIYRINDEDNKYGPRSAEYSISKDKAGGGWSFPYEEIESITEKIE